MNTEKLEKLEKFKKQLDNKLIPDGVKDKIRNEIEKLESEIKSEDITATELKKEVAKVEEKVEVAVEKAEKKAESTEPKKGRGRPRKTPATTPAEPKATETAIKKTAMVVAKTIRKDGEKWNDAMKRANGVMKKEKVEVKKTTKSELDRLLARVRKNKSLMSELKGVKDLGRDAVREAKPMGKRISEKGRKNGFGTTEGGNVYYEYRANKTDRKTYGKYAFADGGDISDVTYAIFNPNQKNGKIETSFGDKTKEGLFAMITNVNYSPEEISKAIFDANDKNGKIKTTYGDKTFSGLTEIIKNVRNTFELGGSVVTDLAGHTGGSFGTGNQSMLDGFSNTAYTGLVGETGAMSSGEMFMNGGGLPAGAEQSYVNYYLGEGASAGIYKDGGAIKNQYAGRTPEDVWNSLSVEQRKHFLLDHISHNEDEWSNGEEIEQLKYRDLGEDYREFIDLYSKSDWKKLSGDVKKSFREHIKEGQYAKGGGIPNNYEGKTPEIVWNMWNENQKEHFIKDHYRHFVIEELTENNILSYSSFEYKELPRSIRLEVDLHVYKGQYAKGGGVRKLGNREYSYGRNWTNDHEHVNQSEEHEVNYTRKGKFLGVFAKGGGVENTKIKDWYIKNYPTDDLGQKINKNVTFEDIYITLKEKKDFYKKIGVGDSLVRERLFEHLSEIKKVNYRDIYNMWLDADYYAKGGGVRKVGNREYSLGRNWTNDHRHTNKSEEHEVNYNRKRFFAGGGSVNDDTPKIYVADLEAYNNGRLVGEWLDLTDYNDADELQDAIQEVLKKSGGEEYAIHDYENIPRSMYSEYMGARDFAELYEMLDLAKENDLPLDVVMEVVSQFDASAVEEYTGTYDSEQDFAEQLVDDLGGIQNFNDFTYYLEISETDRRLLSQEMADSYVDDIREEDGGNRLIEEAGLDVDEYEEADSDRQEEMLDEAREIVYDEYYNTWFDGLSDPYYFLVEEQGLYDDESFANANFVRVDYEKLGDALEQDYTFVRHDGQIYVFNIR